MRARLARAAFDVIADRGHSALRTATVAARAGVSQGALVHHFATKEGLTLAAVEHAFQQATALTNEIITEGLEAGDDVLHMMLRDFRLFFFDDNFWVSLDITINGSKTSALKDGIAEIVPRYRLGVYDRWSEVLVEAGWSSADATEIVRMSAALIAGLGIRTLFDDVSGVIDPTLERWRGMINAAWPRTAG